MSLKLTGGVFSTEPPGKPLGLVILTPVSIVLGQYINSCFSKDLPRSWEVEIFKHLGSGVSLPGA